MNNSLLSKVKVVGLMLILALLLFCAWKDVQRRTAMMNEQVESETQEVQDEETERVVDPEKPMIALSFDDGPSKFTMQILEELEKYDAKATFFLAGENIGRHVDIVKKMHALGCEIGNHTMHHARLTTLDEAGILAEINKTDEALRAVIGEPTQYLRPPYGSVDDRIMALAGKPLAMWSVDTRDWESKDANAINDHVLNTVQDGDIVLMHDIHEPTVEAVRKLLPELAARGYQLVTIGEMADARGVTLENGVKYYKFNK